jgi:hypothetical protein
MRILTLSFLLALAIDATAQVKITGKVYDISDKELLPGVTVKELNTNNGTNTNLEGKFTLQVEDLPTTLEFSFIGMVPKKITIENSDELTVEMVADCNKDSFDHQLIGFNLNSGIINNPYGGQLLLTFPAFLRSTTFKTGIGYQTNFDDNENLTAHFTIDHIVFKCDYELDVNFNYQQINIGDQLNFISRAIETHFVIDKYYAKINYIKIIAGATNFEYRNSQNQDFKTVFAPIIGVGFILGEWTRLHLDAKVIPSINNTIYDMLLSRNFKFINTNIHFQKMKNYTEISLGIGTKIGYRLRKR